MTKNRAANSLPVVFAGAVLALVVVHPAAAHTALMSCFENEDGTITCEAGYSDGAPAASQAIQVFDANGPLLIDAVFDEDNTYSFAPPDVPVYYVEFIGDAAHSVTVYNDEIIPFE